jgi:hypothetical protein
MLQEQRRHQLASSHFLLPFDYPHEDRENPTRPSKAFEIALVESRAAQYSAAGNPAAGTRREAQTLLPVWIRVFLSSPLDAMFERCHRDLVSESSCYVQIGFLGLSPESIVLLS